MTSHPLDSVELYLRDYVSLPTEYDYPTIAAWAAHTHVIQLLDTTPRLAIFSPEFGCGKSVLMEAVGFVAHDPVMLANTSPAFIYRKVDSAEHPPTLLLDEADTVFTSNAGESAQDLRGLINSGYRRGATVGRVSGPQRDKLQEFRTFSPLALAGRGRDSVPESVMTRSVIIPMRKMKRGDRLKPWKRRDAEPRGFDLRESLAEWSSVYLNSGPLNYPELPGEITGRDAEVWEPLIMVADLAGGEWPARLRAAALAQVNAGRESDPDAVPWARRLLMDTRTVWPDSERTDRISTADLIDRLNALADSPWSGRSANGITPWMLSKWLQDYGIRPGTVRFPNGHISKGYERAGFMDAWERYLDSPPTPVEAVTSVTAVTSERGKSESVRSAESVTDVTAVTDLAGEVAKVIRCGRKGCRSAAGPSGYCHSHIPLGPCDICGEPMFGSAHLSCLAK